MGNFIKSAIQELDRECQKEFKMGLKEFIQHKPSLRGDFAEEILKQVHCQADIFHERQLNIFFRNTSRIVINARIERAIALNKFPNDQQIERALKEIISNFLDDFLEKAS